MNKFNVNGETYVVDGVYVILDTSENEKRVARIMSNEFGCEVQLVPRILKPDKIKTPDYIIFNERYDLKTINGNSKSVLYNALTGKKMQAENFVFDITNCKLDVTEIQNQAKLIFESIHMKFVNRIVIIKGDTILNVYERK